MLLVPHLNTIVSSVDRIHRATGYGGGRFRICEFTSRFPGFNLLRSPAAKFPAGVYSAMERDSTGTTITVRLEDPPENRRYAAARLIGAAVLFEGQIPDLALWRDVPTSPAISFYQADSFARLLLMPLWAVEEALLAHSEKADLSSPSPALVSKMAADFDVPCCMARTQIENYGMVRPIAPIPAPFVSAAQAS